MNTKSQDVFVGRRVELGRLLDNIRTGTHTMVVGAKGSGKSALIAQALRVLAGERQDIEWSERISALKRGRLVEPRRTPVTVLLVSTLAPFGECLRHIARELWNEGTLALPAELAGCTDWNTVRKWFGTLGRSGQEELLFHTLRSSRAPELLVFDSLDRISPSHVRLLEECLERKTVVAAASRLNDAFHFTKLWSSFSRIELGPLGRHEARRLIELLLDTYAFRPSDHELFVREVLNASKCIPFYIRTGVWRASRVREPSRRAIRSLRSIEEGAYFNMGPIYIFSASIFTLYKILSIGMDNREFYIYFSALGFFVYLSFRVFRNFFLFRPQRKR